MSDDDEINPDSVSLEDVQDMEQGEFRQYVYLKFEEICGKVDKLDTRLWGILTGVIITILLVVARILIGG